jgi:hypothetical protein
MELELQMNGATRAKFVAAHLTIPVIRGYVTATYPNDPGYLIKPHSLSIGFTIPNVRFSVVLYLNYELESSIFQKVINNRIHIVALFVRGELLLVP